MTHTEPEKRGMGDKKKDSWDIDWGRQKLITNIWQGGHLLKSGHFYWCVIILGSSSALLLLDNCCGTKILK